MICYQALLLTLYPLALISILFLFFLFLLLQLYSRKLSAQEMSITDSKTSALHTTHSKVMV